MRNPLNLIPSPRSAAAFGGIGLVFLLWCGFAAATEIASVQGPAYVNRGTESIPATKGMKLEVGDRVVVLEQADVQILYNDGCVEPFAAKSAVVTIKLESPCAERGLVARNGKPVEGVAAASTTASEPAATVSETSGGAAGGAAAGATEDSSTTRLITIAAIVLPAIVALSFNKGFSSSPANPLSP